MLWRIVKSACNVQDLATPHWRTVPVSSGAFRDFLDPLASLSVHFLQTLFAKEGIHLMNMPQKEGAPDTTDRAESLMLFVGLANLSSSSQGTSPFLWVLHVPDASLTEQMPAQSGPNFGFLKRIGMLMTSMIKWRQGLRFRPGFRLRS